MAGLVNFVRDLVARSGKQADIARRARYSQGQISRMINGQLRLHREGLERLADACEASDADRATLWRLFAEESQATPRAGGASSDEDEASTLTRMLSAASIEIDHLHAENEQLISHLSEAGLVLERTYEWIRDRGSEASQEVDLLAAANHEAQGAQAMVAELLAIALRLAWAIDRQQRGDSSLLPSPSDLDRIARLLMRDSAALAFPSSLAGAIDRLRTQSDRLRRFTAAEIPPTGAGTEANPCDTG